jgi:four helix bundle protein
MAEGDKLDLKRRTKALSLRIIRFYSALPDRVDAQVLGKQLLRSGTSVGANYREACRARSLAEFISKMEIGLQELEESTYWLELFVEAEIVSARRLSDLQGEVNELTRIFVASIKTAKEQR